MNVDLLSKVRPNPSAIRTLLRDAPKRALRRIGWDLRRWDIDTSSEARAVQRLRSHGVNLVFDVGANAGQFARSLRNAGYAGRIVSFEPLSHAWEYLQTVSRLYKWEVAARMAIGSEDGEVSIHVAANSASSSILNMLPSHLSAAPESTYVGTEQVAVRRLDTVGGQYVQSDSVLFIKVDTQGFESEVIAGATDMIRRCVGVQLELSAVPLYENDRRYDALMEQMASCGFELWGIDPGFTDPDSGRLLQFDASFFRPRL